MVGPEAIFFVPPIIPTPTAGVYMCVPVPVSFGHALHGLARACTLTDSAPVLSTHAGEKSS